MNSTNESAATPDSTAAMRTRPRIGRVPGSRSHIGAGRTAAVGRCAVNTINQG